MSNLDHVYYVYMYIDPMGTPFYVGKGKGYRYTVAIHMRKSSRNGLLKNKIRKIGESNIKVQFLQQNLSEEYSFFWERYWIKYIGRRDKGEGPLCNLTDGGDGTSGWSPSKETREKISRANKAKALLPEYVPINYWKGKKRSLEDRLKISKTVSVKMKGIRKGIPLTAEHKATLSASAKRRAPITEENRKILSAAVTKWWKKRKEMLNNIEAV